MDEKKDTKDGQRGRWMERKCGWNKRYCGWMNENIVWMDRKTL